MRSVSSSPTTRAAIAVAEAARRLPHTAADCIANTTVWRDRRPIITSCGRCPRCRLDAAVERYEATLASEER